MNRLGSLLVVSILSAISALAEDAIDRVTTVFFYADSSCGAWDGSKEDVAERAQYL